MKVIAVTSGKGGVGKTNLSANLALALAGFGERVVVLDGDIGLANLDVVLGCRAEWTLQDVIQGERGLLEVVQQGPGGIRFIAGGSGIENLFSLDSAQAERFTADLAILAATTDILILDTGAGLDSNVLTLLSAANEILVVVTPDPASITDGYATIKAIVSTNPSAKLSLIINQVADRVEAGEISEHLNGVCQRFLKLTFPMAGYVRLDPNALTYIRNRVPFVLGDRTLPASVDVIKIAAAMIGKVPPEAEVLDFKSKIRSIFKFARRSA